MASFSECCIVVKWTSAVMTAVFRKLENSSWPQVVSPQKRCIHYKIGRDSKPISKPCNNILGYNRSILYHGLCYQKRRRLTGLLQWKQSSNRPYHQMCPWKGHLTLKKQLQITVNSCTGWLWCNWSNANSCARHCALQITQSNSNCLVLWDWCANWRLKLTWWTRRWSWCQCISVR